MTLSPEIAFTGTATIGKRTLFRALELTIAAGRTTCLLGASGVGKSTILRLIAKLETGVAFDGQIHLSPQTRLQDHVGYMAQGAELFPWLSVLENVTLGARLRGERKDNDKAMHYLEKVGLHAHQHKRPSMLSGGEKQRVALARTLMEDRPVILLDEPFSALDAKTRSEMQELTAELFNGRTVLLVTHDPSEAVRLGHHIFVLKHEILIEIDVPPSPPVRSFDDPESLTCQGALYRILRDMA